MPESYDHRNDSVKPMFRSPATTGCFYGRNLLIMPSKTPFHRHRGRVRNNFKRMRQTAGLTQEQLADRMETTKARVSMKERGKEGWDDAWLAAMAEALGLDDPVLLLIRPDAPESALAGLTPAEQAKVIDYAETLKRARQSGDKPT
jgi:transcriptional regulator with XRE-family HTH domain